MQEVAQDGNSDELSQGGKACLEARSSAGAEPHSDDYPLRGVRAQQDGY